ncbi:hypothetical protein [Mycobacterium sp. DL440]|uniref:hypothetical protein n=1 Tax=Mycobacterium sp. DL440 TaxID=2675523 RepID=UPI00142066D7|nr:hypothetical protein [Mycobacterium sp. DL440]
MRRIVAGIVVAGFALSGCSTVTAGTPMGDPDQTGISTTTTTKRRPTNTAAPSTPVVPRPGTSSGASTPPPNGMSTTCREYSSMNEATQLGMVELLVENGYAGMKKNPFLWTSFIGAMCVLADRDSTVVDAINKKVPG